jgi:hypothetical protein
VTPDEKALKSLPVPAPEPPTGLTVENSATMWSDELFK